jgi:hypothetical protein
VVDVLGFTSILAMQPFKFELGSKGGNLGLGSEEAVSQLQEFIVFFGDCCFEDVQLLDLLLQGLVKCP